MEDQQLLRYSRHILLPQVDEAGQRRLLAAHGVVVGLGGLGCPAATYLATSGIGRLTVCDGDTVELTNLQRQPLHSTRDLGRTKADSAWETLASLNPEIEITPVATRLDADQLLELARQADVVIDASDNFATRFAVNQACVNAGTPLVSGAAIGLAGQVAVFRADLAAGPCYACLFPDAGDDPATCTESGVLASVPGIIGCIQAHEALKVLMGLGEPLQGRLLSLDAMAMQWRESQLRRDPRCPVCASAAARRA